MHHIVIISGSVRTGRKSHNVAMYFNKYITESKLATSEMLDLKEFNFPLMEERIAMTAAPSEKAILFSNKIKKADAVIVVSPEYNGATPASVKNAMDMLGKELLRKPIGIVGVSSGSFGGALAISQLQSLFLRFKALPVTTYPVPNVETSFDEQGNANDKVLADKRTSIFLSDLIWITEAVCKMK